jgi:hypothetical protein
MDIGERLTVVVAHDEAGVQFLDSPGGKRRTFVIADRWWNQVSARLSVPNISARGPRLIFRRTSSTSEKPAVSLKATSPRVANSGCRIANKPDEATIAAAIVAARANLLMAKCIAMIPSPWDQFDTNYFQHRWVWMRDLNQYFRDSVTMFIPSRLALAEGRSSVDRIS